MESNLKDFGYSFQVKSIFLLLNDYEFCTNCVEILKPEYYSSQSLQWIVKAIFSHYKEYGIIPTMEIIKVYHSKLDADEIFKDQIISDLREIYKSSSDHVMNSEEFVKNEIINFSLNQEMKQAITSCIPLLKKNDFDGIRKLVNGALIKGVSLDLGSKYLDTFEKRYSEDFRKPVPTPWHAINAITKGGLSAGEIGTIIAPTGGGKSWGLAHIGAYAVKLGYSVVHYTLELNEDYVNLRYDNILTRVSIDHILDHKEDVWKKINSIQGNLRVKYYPTKSVSLETIKSHLDKLKMIGEVPDLIIIDYADLIKTKESDDNAANLQGLYEEIRGLSGIYNAPVWTASQTNRDGLEEDFVTNKTIAGSFGKAMTSDFIMTISRKEKDKVKNTARVSITKNRNGRDGMQMGAILDTENGILDIFDPDDPKGKSLLSEMVTDEEYQRTELGKRYDELFKNRRS